MQGFFPLFFVLLFLSSMSLPRPLIEQDWFRFIATYNPVSYLIEGIRSFIITGWDAEALALAFGIAIVIAAGCGHGRVVRPADEAGADMRRFAQVAGAVAWRSIHNVATNPAFLLPSIIFPMFFFVAFAGGLSNVANVPGLRLPVGLHGVPVRVRAAPGVGVRRRVHRLRHRGRLRARLRAAAAAGGPEPRRDHRRLRARRVGADDARRHCCCSSSRCSPGCRSAAAALDIFGLIVLAYLVSLAATLFAAGVAMRLRTLQAGPAMQMPVFLVLFLAPVYVPLELLGGWVHGVAKVNPFTPLIETGRDFISGSPGDAALAYGIVAALVALFAWWAVRGLRSARRPPAVP